MRVFVDLETEAKPRFLNHEDPRAWLLTDLERGLILGYFYSEPLVSTIVMINKNVTTAYLKMVDALGSLY